MRYARALHVRTEWLCPLVCRGNSDNITSERVLRGRSASSPERVSNGAAGEPEAIRALAVRSSRRSLTALALLDPSGTVSRSCTYFTYYVFDRMCEPISSSGGDSRSGRARKRFSAAKSEPDASCACASSIGRFGRRVRRETVSGARQ